MMTAATDKDPDRLSALSGLLSSDDEEDATSRAAVKPNFSLFGSRRIQKMVGVEPGTELALQNQTQNQNQNQPGKIPVPLVDLDIISRVYMGCVDIIVHTPHADSPFFIALPLELEELAQGAPFRILVDKLELRDYSCSDPTASCYLRMDRAVELAPHSNILTITRTIPAPRHPASLASVRAPEVSCYLPFGTHARFDPPALLYERIVHLNKGDRQREYRYSFFRAAHEMVEALQFDKKSGRLTLNPAAPEPIVMTLFRCNPDPALRPEDRTHTHPRREHFNFVLQGAKDEYFEKKRAQLFYANQLTGSVIADQQCKVKLRFAITIAYSLPKKGHAAL